MKNRLGLIAKKVGNSSFFTDNGNAIPVTIVKVTSNVCGPPSTSSS